MQDALVDDSSLNLYIMIYDICIHPSYRNIQSLQWTIVWKPSSVSCVRSCSSCQLLFFAEPASSTQKHKPILVSTRRTKGCNSWGPWQCSPKPPDHFWLEPDRLNSIRNSQRRVVEHSWADICLSCVSKMQMNKYDHACSSYIHRIIIMTVIMYRP